MDKKLEIELIIFDLDGLMFDTEKISFIAWKEAAGIYNYQINQALFEKTIGTNLAKTKEIYLEALGENFPFDLVRDQRVILSDEIIKTNGVPIKKGLLELLNYLKQTDLKMAVATSTSRSRALNLLRQVDIENYFDYILCGDEVEHSKPNPEIFQRVADKLKCMPNKCIVLEDSELGVTAAYKAGMMPIMIPDLKEPSNQIIAYVYRRMNSLLDVKSFFEAYFHESKYCCVWE